MSKYKYSLFALITFLIPLGTCIEIAPAALASFSSDEELIETAPLHAGKRLRKEKRKVEKRQRGVPETAETDLSREPSVEEELSSQEAAVPRLERSLFGPPIPPRAPKALPKDDDSDEEDSSQSSSPPPNAFKEIIRMGVEIKLVANVYLRNLFQRANVFLPYCVFDSEEGVNADFFRTKKGEICVFVSGGLQNAWEKTVCYIYERFFGHKIKIIRANWIQKHLYVERKEEFRIADSYRGREEELHSELYFSMFLQKLFTPPHPLGTNGAMSVQAFSWWDVCNGCERLLCNKPSWLPPAWNYTFAVASHRRYSHHYPSSSALTTYRVPRIDDLESVVWLQIRNHIEGYVSRFAGKSDADKGYFWTQTREGLEVCKWMAQAFANDDTKARKKGDLRNHILGDEAGIRERLGTLLEYLKQVNWDLSCWFHDIPFSNFQKKWGRHWRQVVTPHFKWQVIYGWEDEDAESICEMCGKEGIRHVFWVYHPKYRVSKAPAEELDPIEAEQLSPFNPTGYYDLPQSQRRKRRQSLSVGRHCVKELIATEDRVQEWRETTYREQREKKDQDELIDRLVKEGRRKQAEQRKREKEARRHKREAREAAR